MTELIPIESVDPIEVFTGTGLDDLLKKVREAAVLNSEEFCVETDKGRKEIASRAYAVARSKTTIDNAGKQLVAKQKAEIAKVDAARKHARDTLDALRDEIRRPLNEWEAEQDRIEREKREAEERERQRQLEDQRRREAELAERERKIREAEEAQRRRDEEARREEQRRVEIEKREELERIERVRREREAAERAEREKKEAIEKALEKEREAQRQREEAAMREREAEQARLRKIEKDRARRLSVHTAIKDALVKKGLSENDSQSAVEHIAAGYVPHLTIDYTAELKEITE